MTALMRYARRAMAAGLAVGAILAGAQGARADLRISLSEDGGAFVVVRTSNDPGQLPKLVGYTGTFGDFDVNFHTTLTNFPPGNGGSIGTFLNTNTTAQLADSVAPDETHTLVVMVEVIDNTANDATSPLSDISIPNTDPLVLNTQFARTGGTTTNSTVTYATLLDGISYGASGTGSTGPNGGFPGQNQNIPHPGATFTLASLTTLTITGGGSDAATTGRSTVLASPEPSTIAMALAGLPVLAVAAFRRRKAQD